MKVRPETQPLENPNLHYLTSQMSLSQEQIIGRRTGQLFLSNQDDPDLHINIKDVFPISNKKKNDISTEKRIPITLHYESNSSSSSNNYSSISEDEAEEIEEKEENEINDKKKIIVKLKKIKLIKKI